MVAQLDLGVEPSGHWRPEGVFNTREIFTQHSFFNIYLNKTPRGTSVPKHSRSSPLPASLSVAKLSSDDAREPTSEPASEPGTNKSQVYPVKQRILGMDPVLEVEAHLHRVVSCGNGIPVGAHPDRYVLPACAVNSV